MEPRLRNQDDVAPLKDDEGREVMRHWRPGEEVKGEGQGWKEDEKKKEEQISLKYKINIYNTDGF